jgi:hypothetical protein
MEGVRGEFHFLKHLIQKRGKFSLTSFSREITELFTTFSSPKEHCESSN